MCITSSPTRPQLSHYHRKPFDASTSCQFIVRDQQLILDEIHWSTSFVSQTDLGEESTIHISDNPPSKARYISLTVVANKILPCRGWKRTSSHFPSQRAAKHDEYANFYLIEVKSLCKREMKLQRSDLEKKCGRTRVDVSEEVKVWVRYRRACGMAGLTWERWCACKIPVGRFSCLTLSTPLFVTL